MNTFWKEFKSEADLDKWAYGARIKRISSWKGPGWYNCSQYTQRCSRGCCDDNVVQIDTPQERIDDIKELMRELAEELKFARSKL